MVVSKRGCPMCKLHIGNTKLKQVRKFKYLGNSSVSRCSDEMATDQLYLIILFFFVFFVGSVRFFGVNNICQELLFVLKLTTDTKSESIFKKLRPILRRTIFHLII